MENNKKIIIADDEEYLRNLTTEIVNAFFPEYNFDYCTNGHELKSRLEKGVEGVVCVLTDNNMGLGPTGSDLIREYARKEGMPPILLIYGANDEDMIGKQAVKDGAIGYLKKPYNIDKFKEAVGNVL